MPGRRSWAFTAPAVVWFGWLVLMAGANLATPLYAVYAQRFGFSSLVLTSVFATYAFVLVPALILFGRLSDRFGRKPIIVAGLIVACAALLLFAFATGVAWLYVARALQGLAVGIVPSYASGLLHTHDLALLATVAAVALLASFAAQVASQRRRPSLQASQAAGLGAIALGLVILVVASPLHSLALLLAGGIVTGAGHGVAFLNAQEELNRIAPDEHRGEVTAAFIGCIYALVAASVIAAGLLALGISLAHSVAAVSVALLVLAIAGAAWQWRVAEG